MAMPASLDVRPFRLKLARPYTYARGSYRHREGALVRARIGDAVGWGDVVPEMSLRLQAPQIARDCARAIWGIDPQDPEAIARLDARAPSPFVRAGVVNAILSARAHAAGRTLAAYMAGTDEPPVRAVPVNALIGGTEPQEAAAKTRAAMAAGFRTLKIKCGPDRAIDLARLERIRDAAPDAALRLDANEAWHPDWALAHLRDLSAFRIDYVEQPLPHGLTDAVLAALAQASPIAIAIDESASDLDTIDRLLGAGASRVVILKQAYLGGIDRVQTAIGIAAAHGCTTVVTSGLESAVGRAASAHAAALLPPPIPDCGLGLGGFFVEDTAPDTPIVNGWLDLPSHPGLGLDAADYWNALPPEASEIAS